MAGKSLLQSSWESIWKPRTSLSSKVRVIGFMALFLASIMALTFIVRQSSALMETTELSVRELARLNKWTRSAWEARPDFDVEYASIIAARASALPSAVLAPPPKEKKEGSESTVDTIIKNVQANVLPEDFHPIDNLLHLINDKEPRKTQRVLLCAAFARVGLKEFASIVANMKVMGDQCDWAVIVTTSSVVSSSATSAKAGAAAAAADLETEQLKTFQEQIKETKVKVVLFQVVEPQHIVLNRYASHTNSKGTDGVLAAGGLSTDALAAGVLQAVSPALHQQYMKHVNPSVLADLSRVEEEEEAGTPSKQEAPPSIWSVEHEEMQGGRIHEDRGDVPLYNSQLYPKGLQYTYLLPVLKKYRRVWLLDSDISLGPSFQVERFLRIVECTFEESPVVAHPIVKFPVNDHDGKRVQDYLSESYWEQERRSGSVDSSAATSIEMKAPVLDAAFFEWFTVRIVVPLLAPIHYLGTDEAFDPLLCTAASIYKSARKVNISSEKGGKNLQRHLSGTSSQSLGPVCVIAVGADPVTSVNHDSVGKRLSSASIESGTTALSNGKRFKSQLTIEMLKILRETLPNFYRNGGAESNDPRRNRYSTARLDEALSKDTECRK